MHGVVQAKNASTHVSIHLISKKISEAISLCSRSVRPNLKWCVTSRTNAGASQANRLDLHAHDRGGGDYTQKTRIQKFESATTLVGNNRPAVFAAGPVSRIFEDFLSSQRSTEPTHRRPASNSTVTLGYIPHLLIYVALQIMLWALCATV